MSTPEHLEVARLFVAKARADLAAADLLAAAEDQHDGVVGFHAQQAVDKALKAVLAVQEIELPRSHDLAFLDLVESVDLEMPEEVERAAWLNPWTVTMRRGRSHRVRFRGTIISSTPHWIGAPGKNRIRRPIRTRLWAYVARPSSATQDFCERWPRDL